MGENHIADVVFLEASLFLVKFCMFNKSELSLVDWNLFISESDLIRALLHSNWQVRLVVDQNFMEVLTVCDPVGVCW